MSKMIAYCGLVCTDCEAYLATQANDLPTLERMAEQARQEYGVPDATAESVMCDGCLADSGRQCGYCMECQIRACNLTRGLVNCAYCADYACQTLQDFFGHASAARAMLDSLRQ